jgi:hypothetical protein
VADISPFLKGRSFDAETVCLMGEAFDAATRELHDTGQPALVREIIAKYIIDFAAKGERDPKQIARRALKTLGITSER